MMSEDSLVRICDLNSEALGEFEHDKVGECRIETVSDVNWRPVFGVKA